MYRQYRQAQPMLFKECKFDLSTFIMQHYRAKAYNNKKCPIAKHSELLMRSDLINKLCVKSTFL